MNRQGSSPFDEVDTPWYEAFSQAWESWSSGSLGIGAVVVAADGAVVARGRNRVLERPGSGPLAGALIAHAEMDAFATLGQRLGTGLSLYTTVSPCLMCSAAAIALRLDHIHCATKDPVFEGLDDVLANHPYCHDRVPPKTHLEQGELAAFARMLPMAFRLWAKPDSPPRKEWLELHVEDWRAAQTVVASGALTELADQKASVIGVLRSVRSMLPS